MLRKSLALAIRMGATAWLLPLPVFCGLLVGVAPAVADCTPVDNCAVPVTCTTSFDSQCTACDSGYYLSDGVADTCPACPAVAHCVSAVTCTSATNSQCTACAAGYYLTSVAGQSQCVPCTAVDECTSALTCTSATTSQCTSCAAGYTLLEGTADTCVPAATATPTGTPTPSVTPTPPPSVTLTPTPTATAAAACATVPRSGCQPPQRAAGISVNAAAYKVGWKWLGGSTLPDVSQFGDPVNGPTAYHLCIYDTSAGPPFLAFSATVPAGGTCGPRPCWKQTHNRFSYTNSLATPDGLRRMTLQAGKTGAHIGASGRGRNLHMPASVDGNSLLREFPEVIVQVQRSDSPTCWEAVFTSPATRSTRGVFADTIR